VLLAGGRPGTGAGLAADGPDSDPARLHYLRGEVAASVGDLAGAERQYDEAVAADPQLAAARAARAVLRYRRGDRDGALADLDAAIRLAPDPVRSAAAVPGQAGHPDRLDRRRAG
jgi:tetratricopeptide (TPR) repeat protein